MQFMQQLALLCIPFLSILAPNLASAAGEQEQPVKRLTFSNGARNGQSFFSPSGSQLSFVSNQSGTWEVWLMNTDGSHPRQLTDTTDTKMAAGWPGWSPDEKSIIFYSPTENGFGFFRADVETGAVSAFPFPPGELRERMDFRPLLSPDGKAMLFDRYGHSTPLNHDLFVYSFSTEKLTPLTADPGYDSDARWSPDGKKIVWHSDRGAERYHTQIYVMDIGSRSVRQLSHGPARQGYPAWSPDGRRIAFTSQPDAARDQRDIWIMDADGGNTVRVTWHEGFDGDPIWTRDGSAVVFSTGRFGGEELAIIPVAEIPR